MIPELDQKREEILKTWEGHKESGQYRWIPKTGSMIECRCGEWVVSDFNKHLANLLIFSGTIKPT